MRAGVSAAPREDEEVTLHFVTFLHSQGADLFFFTFWGFIEKP
jgi:hypothetical protein